jgi:hypothetical protein
MKANAEMIGNRMQTFFGSQVQAVARQTKFVRRRSDLTGGIFLRAMVFACIEHSTATLNQFAQACLDLGLAISPQGLNERIGTESVAFTKEMFRQAIDIFRSDLPLPLSILQQFSGLYMIDSSVISLPSAMGNEYPGCGGDGPQASLKIQLLFEFLRGNLEQIVFRPGRDPDQRYRDHLTIIRAGSLTLMDLGYFALEHLKAVAEQAYFLTRYLYPTGLLTTSEEPIDLLRTLQAQPGDVLDMNVLLGTRKNHQIPARLVARRLRQEVADRRRQKAKEHARCDRRQVTKAYLALLDWDIFLTNVPDTMLSALQVTLLYRVRWQIELIFKLCKSYCGLRHVANLRKDRILTELYARMIGVILTYFLVAPLRMPYGAQANREISPVQVRRIFRRFVRSLNQALANLDQLVRNLVDMLEHFLHFGFKQKRKRRPNVCHALHLASAIYCLDLNLEKELDLLTLLA